MRIRTKKFNKSGREGQYNQKFEVIFIDSSTETIGKWSVTGKTKDFFFFLKDAFENTKDFSENNKIT